MFYLSLKSNQTVFHLSCARTTLRAIYQQVEKPSVSMTWLSRHVVRAHGSRKGDRRSVKILRTQSLW